MSSQSDLEQYRPIWRSIVAAAVYIWRREQPTIVDAYSIADTFIDQLGRDLEAADKP
jgi:hypothetical protein